MQPHWPVSLDHFTSLRASRTSLAGGSILRVSNMPPFKYSCFLLCVDELRQAARFLFDASVARLPDDETNIIAEHWQHHCESKIHVFNHG
jgi:hypothetical protein